MSTVDGQAGGRVSGRVSRLGPARPWPAGYGRFFAVRLLLRSYFFLPYIVLYAAQIGISLPTLLLIEAVFALLVVAGDVPAGYLGDRIGPRQALIVGTGCEAVAVLALYAVPDPVCFWAVQPLFAAAAALTLGSDSALAARLLRRAGRTAEFESGERLLHSAALAWNTVVFVAASAVSLAGLRLTFLATGIALVAATLLLLTVAQGSAAPPGEAADPGEERVGLAGWLRRTGATIAAAPALRTDLAAMVLTGTAFSVLLYLMPVYLVGAGLSAYLVGVATAGISLAAAGLAYLLPGRLDLRVAALLAVAASVALVLPVALPVLAAAVLIQVSQARLLPRYRARVLADLGEHGDAAAMSIVTTSANIGFALVAPFLGLVAGRLEVGGLALVCAVLFAAAGLIMSGRLRHDPTGTGRAGQAGLGGQAGQRGQGGQAEPVPAGRSHDG